MSKNRIIIPVFFLLLMIAGCVAKSEGTHVGYTSVKSADFKNDSTIVGILDAYIYNDHYSGAIFGGYYTTDNGIFSGEYPVEINISDNSNTIIGNKITGNEIICGNNVIALISNSSYMSTLVQFISKSSYQNVTTFALPSASNPLDIANDDRVLYDTGYAGALCEYTLIDAKTNTVLAGNISAAKYDPLDNSVIAYVDAVSRHLFIINSNGSGNTDILSGVGDICWSPDGNSIIFTTDTEVRMIGKDGTGLIKLADYTFPSMTRAICLKHDQLVFVLDTGLIKYDF